MTDTKIDIGFLLAHGLSRAAAESLMQEIERVLAIGYVPREELESVRMEAAAMRGALQGLVPFAECVADVRCAKCHALDVLHDSNAGRDYMSREHHFDILRKFASGVCSAHQDPDPECEVCNIKLRLPQMIEEHRRVWLEQVKPLVDALRSIEFDRVAADSTGRRPLHVWLSEEKCNAIRDALDHARKLGFPTTQATPGSAGALTGGQCVEGAETAKE